MPLAFFVPLVAVSLPLWILAALPGDPLRGLLPFKLPFSALVAFCPVVAASIVEYHRGGLTGIRDLLKRAVDYQPAHWGWYVIALVMMPTILMLAYLAMRITERPLPPDPSIPRWILWRSVTAVALRVLLVWVYINAGRGVLAASVLHASSNVSEFGFRNSGSHYDPFVAADPTRRGGTPSLPSGTARHAPRRRVSD